MKELMKQKHWGSGYNQLSLMLYTGYWGIHFESGVYPKIKDDEYPEIFDSTGFSFEIKILCLCLSIFLTPSKWFKKNDKEQNPPSD